MFNIMNQIQLCCLLIYTSDIIILLQHSSTSAKYSSTSAKFIHSFIHTKVIFIHVVATFTQSYKRISETFIHSFIMQIHSFIVNKTKGPKHSFIKNSKCKFINSNSKYKFIHSYEPLQSSFHSFRNYKIERF
jgi:hypothetical protein